MSCHPYIFNNTDVGDRNSFEVWRNERAFFCRDNDGGYGGKPIKFVASRGKTYYRTPIGFYLPLLKSYMRGLPYKIGLDAPFVDSFITSDGLCIPKNEPQFVPFVNEATLPEFAVRCLQHGMFA